MTADFSRVRLNPLLDYAGVELKQGGVLLDADANELVAILDRRLRALASDTLGRATVSSTTPNAFKIAAVGGSLTIQPGRLYVDGLLAECHGAVSDGPVKRSFDDLMAEAVFADAVNYAKQPYLPSPPVLPTAGRHLVYLDVWDREVTHLEQPDLVEKAVAVETSSRVQTVWQVRVLGDAAGSAACASPDGDLSGWSDTIVASTGLLTTGTYEVPPTDNPCELPPTGGYRGLENQLYRVEIHDPGQPGGTATFTWSRENASVGSRVASMISASELELEILGRDDVLRISTGDWVEILDDARDFSQTSGELRKVTVVDASRRIQFMPALPAAMLPGSFPDSDFPKARNLRVQRWDQQGKVYRTDPSGTPVEVQNLDDINSTGAIRVPAAGTTLLLENGITVSFDSTGAAGFKAGDWWVFAARTADASVELLDRASPRGTHHHYARLGIWDVAAGTVSDCRNPWPPAAGGSDCGCTQCVTPESHASGQFTIQDAVDRLHDTGGTVCLKTGQYPLRGPVRLSGARSLTIRGRGPATVVIASGEAFVVTRSMAVAVEDLAVISLGKQSAISVQTVLGLALRELVVLMLGDAKVQGAAVALSGMVAAATVADNVIVAGDGIRAGDPSDEKAPAWLATAALAIENNVLWCQRSGIALVGAVAQLYETRIGGNQVIGCRTGGVSALGLALPGAALRLSGNTLAVDGPGIRATGDGAWICDNKFHAVAAGDTQPAGSAIAVVRGFARGDGGQCQILANQIDGFPDAGILVDAPLSELVVKQNLIENCGNGILMIDNASADQLAIENNQLRGIDGTRSSEALAPGTIGIGVTRSDSASIAGNVLRQVGTQTTQNRQLIVGILALAVRRSRIAGNDAVEIGPQADFGGTVAGVLVRPPFDHAAIMQNHVERDADLVLQVSDTAWQALAVGDSSTKLTEGNLASRVGRYSTLRVDDTRTLVLYGNRATVNLVGTVVGFGAGSPPVSASMLGNVLVARGRAPAVEVSATEVQFSDNRCELRANQSTAAVLLNTSVAVVNGNRVRGAEVSIAVPNEKARVVALGNITTNGIKATLPPEMQALNLIG